MLRPRETQRPRSRLVEAFFFFFFLSLLLHLENFLSIIKISSKANSTVGVTSWSAGPVCLRERGPCSLPPAWPPLPSEGPAWPLLCSPPPPGPLSPPEQTLLSAGPSDTLGGLAHRSSRAPHSAWTIAFLEKSEAWKTKTSMTANGQTNIKKYFKFNCFSYI